jgi:DNA-binding CsgD family transcriptional regulator
MLIAVGDLPDAAACLAAAQDEINDVGDVLWNDAPRVFLGCLRVAEGRLDEALVEVEGALAQAERLGTRLLTPLAHLTCARVALLRGDLDEAARQLRAVPAGTAPRVGYGSALRVWLEARLAAGRHGPSAVLDVAALVYAEPVAHWRLFVEESAAAPWFVRAALAAGRTQEAVAVAGCAQQVAAMNPGVGSVAAGADHARGLLTRHADVLDQAAAAHTRAWAQGSAMEDAAVVLLDRGDEGGARERLDAAVSRYELAGATHDAARVRGRLRHAATRPSGRDGRPVRGWASLTETEGRVAELVASGLTNPKVGERVYLSRHTIDFHLRQIYRKLEIHSRVELARLVARRELRQ